MDIGHFTPYISYEVLRFGVMAEMTSGHMTPFGGLQMTP